MSLFDESEAANRRVALPLAARMRPRSLDEFVGQQHFLGPGKLLRRLLAADRLGLGHLLRSAGNRQDDAGPPAGHGQPQRLSATQRGGQRREGAARGARSSPRSACRRPARRRCCSSTRSIASTGPSKTCCCPTSKRESWCWSARRRRIRSSRSTAPWSAAAGCFSSSRFRPTKSSSCCARRLADTERGLGQEQVTIDDDALEFLAEVSDGDARRALGALEVGVLSSPERPLRFTRALAAESVQRKAIEYDRQGDAHYDSASALIKSIRGSDPDAAIYWLARMLEAGEEVRFLARRLVILASEDVGNADPQALPLAVAAMQACEFVGLPECQLTLAQAVTYLACAPKSNAATVAIGEARHDVREGRLVPVPRHLRDRHYTGAKRLGHGEGYQYAHNSAGGVAAQDYLGVDREYYRPVDRGFERELGERLAKIRALLRRDGRSTSQPRQSSGE